MVSSLRAASDEAVRQIVAWVNVLYLEKGDLKKLDTAGKTDAIADKAAGFSASFPKISFEEGLATMGPVRNLYENRPV